MHRNIGTPVEQTNFQLFDKQTLAADLGKWCVEKLVTAGFHGQ